MKTLLEIIIGKLLGLAEYLGVMLFLIGLIVLVSTVVGHIYLAGEQDTIWLLSWPVTVSAICICVFGLFISRNATRITKSLDEPPENEPLEPKSVKPKTVVLFFLWLLLFIGGAVGLNTLGIDAPWNLGYTLCGLLLFVMLIYKERRERLGPEAADDRLPFMALIFVLIGSRILLEEYCGLGGFESFLWSLPGAVIATGVVEITVNKNKADRAGDKKLSETEEPGSGSSPAKESEEAGK